MSPRRGNLASPLGLFSYQVIAWSCSPKCSSVSTESYWEGPVGCAVSVWAAFTTSACGVASLAIGWDVAVHVVSHVLAHSCLGCAPHARVCCSLLQSSLDAQHALGSRSRGNSAALAQVLSPAVHSLGKFPVASSAAKDLLPVCSVSIGSCQSLFNGGSYFNSSPSLTQGLHGLLVIEREYNSWENHMAQMLLLSTAWLGLVWIS